MDLYTNLFNCMEELSTTFTRRMAQYEEDLKNAGGESTIHKSVASLSRDFTEFKGLIWKTLGALKSQMELLVKGLDRHEMASRAKVLLLHGFSEDDTGDLTGRVIKVFSDKMNITSVSSKDIAVCHRLGSDTSKPRPLLVRFENRATRSEVWRNKSKLKGIGLTLSEFLTKPRHDLFVCARRHYGVRQCWTSDGKIIVQVTDNSRHKIETAAELQHLLRTFPVAESKSASTSTTGTVLHKKPRK